jgi:hypothetical protein
MLARASPLTWQARRRASHQRHQIVMNVVDSEVIRQMNPLSFIDLFAFYLYMYMSVNGTRRFLAGNLFGR